MSTTQVAEKDLPPAPEVKLINAPATLEDAIKRIMEVEMRLEDLSRACEIAVITRQFEIVEAFTQSANESLINKIVMEQPSLDDFKLTVITDEKEEDVKA
jgi:hypothetical protein